MQKRIFIISNHDNKSLHCTHMKLQIGDKAPDFDALDQDGKRVRLADFVGQQVVLYFYPTDNTPGCTSQACDLRDNYTRLTEAGYVVLGVSRNDAQSHIGFIKTHQLPFRLLVDSDKSLHTAYGTWGERSAYGRTYMGVFRTTFIIDKQGIIAHIISKVDTKNHSAQILS